MGRDAERLRFVVRGVLRLASSVDNGQDRRLLTGSEEQVRDDLAALAGQGVTEVFIDLNFDPAIGSPSADAAESMRTAEEVLEAFAPDEDRGQVGPAQGSVSAVLDRAAVAFAAAVRRHDGRGDLAPRSANPL